MPPGADAVLPFAAVAVIGATSRSPSRWPRATASCRRAFAWRRGETVVPAGRRLSALDLARAAEAGLEEVECFAAPRCGCSSPGPKEVAIMVDPLSLL